MQSQIVLTYRGPNVDDHTISLDDLLVSVQGFYSSIKLIRDYHGFEQDLEIRLENLEDGSVKLKLKAIWNDASPNARLAALTTVAVPLITIIGSQLTEVISLKKHLQGLPANNVEYHGQNVTVYNINNSSMDVSPEVLDLATDEKISKSLNRYVRPLQENRIEETKFEFIDEDESVKESSISAEEKNSFTEIDKEITKTEQVTLIGKLVSLNKERNTGSFSPQSGSSIRYKFAADSPESMYYDFAYNGTVQVTGLAKFNNEDKITSIEIYSVEKLQQELPFGESE